MFFNPIFKSRWFSKPVSSGSTPRCLQPWPSCCCCCSSLTCANNLLKNDHVNHFDKSLLTVLLCTGALDPPCLLLGSLSLSQPSRSSSLSSLPFFVPAPSKISVVHRWNLFPLYLQSILTEYHRWRILGKTRKLEGFPIDSVEVSYVNGNWQSFPVTERQGRNLKLVQAEKEICRRGSPASNSP